MVPVRRWILHEFLIDHLFSFFRFDLVLDRVLTLSRTGCEWPLRKLFIFSDCSGFTMGNSALKAHLETAQKTGVFQLTGKGLNEVGSITVVVNPVAAELTQPACFDVLSK